MLDMLTSWQLVGVNIEWQMRGNLFWFDEMTTRPYFSSYKQGPSWNQRKYYFTHQHYSPDLQWYEIGSDLELHPTWLLLSWLQITKWPVVTNRLNAVLYMK